MPRATVAVMGTSTALPILRLRLHQAAASIGQLPGAAHRSQARHGFSARFMAMFEWKKANANLEEGNDPEILKRNQAKID